MKIDHTLLHGLALSLIASAYIIITFLINPRIWLHDYPQAIQDLLPPINEKEKRLSLILGIPFLLLLFIVPLVSTILLKNHNPDFSYLSLAFNAFGVAFAFNVVDWLVLDWLMFCTITPGFVVLPGSEGAVAYKDYWFHFRGFLIGTVISIIAGLIIGGVVLLF
jgi:hypothetical protein